MDRRVPSPPFQDLTPGSPPRCRGRLGETTALERWSGKMRTLMTSASTSLARAEQAARDIDGFRHWIRGAGGADLIAICGVIGGETWARRARLARHSVVEEHGPYVMRARLQAPLKLLRLGQAGRMPGVDDTTFAGIGPDDPRAATVQICIEQIERGLGALAVVSLAGACSKRRAAR